MESLGVTLLDMVLLLLNVYGREAHTRGPYTKHVTSFEEIADLDLGFKLKFLKDNGVNIARGDISAHLKFKVSENGDIRSPDNERIQIDDEIGRFWLAVETLMFVFEDCDLLRYMVRVTEPLSNKRIVAVFV